MVAIFGMNMVSQDTHWGWPAGSLLIVSLLSYLLTRNTEILYYVFPTEKKSHPLRRGVVWLITRASFFRRYWKTRKLPP